MRKYWLSCVCVGRGPIWGRRGVPPRPSRQTGRLRLSGSSACPRCSHKGSVQPDATDGNGRANGAHIGEQKGPTWVQGYTWRSKASLARSGPLLLCLPGGPVTVGPPGETESGSAGTQPDKG